MNRVITKGYTRHRRRRLFRRQLNKSHTRHHTTVALLNPHISARSEISLSPSSHSLLHFFTSCSNVVRSDTWRSKSCKCVPLLRAEHNVFSGNFNLHSKHLFHFLCLHSETTAFLGSTAAHKDSMKSISVRGHTSSIQVRCSYPVRLLMCCIRTWISSYVPANKSSGSNAIYLFPIFSIAEKCQQIL